MYLIGLPMKTFPCLRSNDRELACERFVEGYEWEMGYSFFRISKAYFRLE